MPTMADMTDIPTTYTPASYGMSHTFECVACVAVVLVILCAELYRRAQTGPNLGSRQSMWYMENCKRILRECAPEAAGLLVVLTIAAALRARGDVTEEGATNETWEEIKRQWPLLMTADTLLSLQAMFRLLVLVSVAIRFRSSAASPVPLSEETALVWLLAGLARVGLLARTKVYMLDGPLGGHIPTACEVMALPPLFMLSFPSLRRAPLKFAFVVAGVSCLAARHRLSLGDDYVADSLWTLAHSCDFFVAFAYLLRTLLLDNVYKGRVTVGFTHLVMAVQQGCSAYYFTTAFDETPELVGRGLPFHILKVGGVAQLGAYLGAIAIYVAECYVESSDGDHTANSGN